MSEAHMHRGERMIKKLMNRLLNLRKIMCSPIKLSKDGAVFKATMMEKEWFIPIRSKSLALWAFNFMKRHERYLDAVREGDIVVEVGSCTGEYTIPAAQRAGKVFAFEADPLGCECIRKNARLHNLNNIEVINRAVSDKVGRRVSLYLLGNISGGRLVEGDTMSTTTMDSYLKEIKVDVLKMTVNGHEPEVLRGATKTLESVRSVIFQSAKHEELIRILEERGFKVRKSKQLDNGVKVALLERGS
jgi:FkbM family methyltransferase